MIVAKKRPGGAFGPLARRLPDPPGLAVSPRHDTNRTGDGTLSCLADVLRFPSNSGDAEAQVVVAVPGPVVVAARRPAVPRRVAPATAAVHAVRASFGQDPLMPPIYSALKKIRGWSPGFSRKPAKPPKGGARTARSFPRAVSHGDGNARFPPAARRPAVVRRAVRSPSSVQRPLAQLPW